MKQVSKNEFLRTFYCKIGLFGVHVRRGLYLRDLFHNHSTQIPSSTQFNVKNTTLHPSGINRKKYLKNHLHHIINEEIKINTK